MNSVQCGPFFTDVSASWDRKHVEATVSRYPLRRGAQPEEVMGTVLYLAGDASSFTTGALIRVDGGQAIMQ